MSYNLNLIPGNRPHIANILRMRAAANADNQILCVSGVLANGHTLYRPQDNAYRIVNSVSNFIERQMNGEQPVLIMFAGFDIINVIPNRPEVENCIRSLALLLNLREWGEPAIAFHTHGSSRLLFNYCFQRPHNSHPRISREQQQYLDWIGCVLGLPKNTVGWHEYFDDFGTT